MVQGIMKLSLWYSLLNLIVLISGLDGFSYSGIVAPKRFAKCFAVILSKTTSHREFTFSKNSILKLNYQSRRAYYLPRLSCRKQDQEALSEASTFTMSPSLAFIVLNAVAVIWGSQHVVIKTAVESYPSTSLLIFWRFLLSSTLFAFPALELIVGLNRPALPEITDTDRLDIVKAGVELGVYTFLGFAFQAIGLETTTAARSAFLLYLNVKIVPFLAAVLFGRRISGFTWLSALMAFSGTCLLSTDGGAPNLGDAWCIAAAVASALFILRLEKFAKLHNAAQMNGVSFITVTTLCGLWVAGDLLTGRLSASTLDSSGSILDTALTTIWEPVQSFPWPVLYLGWVATGLCNYLQTLGQRYVPAERAAIIYSMDPVYGAIFSMLFLNEQFGIQGYVGAGLIMLGVYISSKQSSPVMEQN